MSAARSGVDLTACTGGSAWWPWIRFANEGGGPLDAPRWILTGGMSALSGEYVGAAVSREPEQ